MKAAVRAIEYYLPEHVVSNADLSRAFPEWPVAKIEEKTGISERHIAALHECSSDLAVEAAEKLFATGVCDRAEIDYVILCTQSPDYFLPSTACIVHDRLRLPKKAGAFDFNLGCSGFVVGLGLAASLVESGQARNVLLLTAETYSKFLHPRDRSTLTIFGDAAAATLISAVASEEWPRYIGPFSYGTDGSGAENLIVRAGGMRMPPSAESAVAAQDENGNWRCPDKLWMNGGEIFTFALREIPNAIDQLLQKAGIGMDDVSRFVFHQANQYMLDHLKRRLRIPEERFVVSMRHCGNTVSSTIPIALKDAFDDGRLQSGQLTMLVGFGVGYSWAATLVRLAVKSNGRQ